MAYLVISFDISCIFYVFTFSVKALPIIHFYFFFCFAEPWQQVNTSIAFARNESPAKHTAWKSLVRIKFHSRNGAITNRDLFLFIIKQNRRGSHTNRPQNFYCGSKSLKNSFWYVTLSQCNFTISYGVIYYIRKMFCFIFFCLNGKSLPI